MNKEEYCKCYIPSTKYITQVDIVCRNCGGKVHSETADRHREKSN